MSPETREKRRARDRARVLTAEQRARKIAKDRERRARIAAERLREPYTAASAEPAHSFAEPAEASGSPAKPPRGPLYVALAFVGVTLVAIGSLAWR